MTNKIIQQLISIRGLKVECPKCADEFPIKRGQLFSMYANYPPTVQKIMRKRLASANQLLLDLLARRKQLAESRRKKPEKITVSARASNYGQISEQILPAFITFPYKRNECRVLLKPIDYIVFTNLCQNGRIETIKFVDVKTGNARLDQRQIIIRDRISEGKVKHRVID